MTCKYVLSPAKAGVSAKYCGKPVKYKMVRDDDWNLVRKYENLCEHCKYRERNSLEPDFFHESEFENW